MITNSEFYIARWGAVSGGKGSGVANQQLQEQNKLQQDAYNLMKQTQDQVKSAVGQYMTGNIGFDPAQLAAMKSQFLNQVANNYNQAGKNVMTALARRGSISSTNPVGGDYVRGIASLEGAAAQDRSSGLANIDITNLQQALNNKFNAASLINGQAAQLTSPISTFGSGANNALNAYITAANSGFGAAFTKALGGALGGGLGAGITGAIGGFMPGGAGMLAGFGSGMRG